MELSKRNHFRHHIVYQYWYKLIRSGKNKAESGKSQGILKTYTSGNPDKTFDMVYNPCALTYKIDYIIDSHAMQCESM